MSNARERLAWRCRRGTQELDLLLRTYLERAFDAAPAREQRAFEQLLERSDPELQRLLLGRQRSEEPNLTIVIEHILGASAYPR